MVVINTHCNATLDEMRIGASEIPITGTITFHNLGLIIAAACTLIAILFSFYLMWMHALHYTNPYQQRHIIRILFMVPVYAVASFLSFWFYWHAIYFRVISECYEAFAIASFFALLCHYIAPNLHEQKAYFRSIQPRAWVLPINWFKKCCGGERGPWRTPRSGLTWFNIVWTSVYQYCFIRVAMTITAVVSQYFGKYCEASNSPVFGHIWILVIEGASVTVAMYGLIQFYVQLKTDLSEHSPFLKVLAIKLVIFLSFWQTFLVSILTSSTLKVVEPTPKIAYPDLKVGIPALLLCIEMAIFSVLHLFAFSYKPYSRGAAPSKFRGASSSGNTGLGGPGPKQGGFLGLGAFIDAMNPWDLVKGFGRGMRWLFVGRKHRENDSSYKNAALNDDENDNDLTLGEAGAPSGGYKSDTAYTGTTHLPIANEFRRSNFGMPSRTARDEEGAGLIAHAQPNPLNQGDSSHIAGGLHYNPSSLQSDPFTTQSSPYVPSRQRYDHAGQDISTGGTRYDSPYGGSPEHITGRPIGQTTPEYSSSYGRSPSRGPATTYNQLPHSTGSTPERSQRTAYRPEAQDADIGTAVTGEPESYHSRVPDPRGRPSEQWRNASRPTSPPGEDPFLGGGPRRNVL